MDCLNESWVHVGLLIDRSGSMEEMDGNELAGSATNLIKEQINSNGITKVTATIANFDDRYEIIKRNIDASDLEITKADIEPRGLTALYTSLGRFIRDIGSDLRDMSERPGTVVIIMLTDGDQTCDCLQNRVEEDKIYEGMNGYKELSKTLKHQEDVYKWKFFMLGTNMDTLEEGPKMGFTPQTCINYSYSTNGGVNALRSTSNAIGRYTEYNTSPMINSDEFDGYTQQERLDSECIENDSINEEDSQCIKNEIVLDHNEDLNNRGEYYDACYLVP